MRAFITGGAGFIGSNLADKLLEQGNEVVVYDDFSTGQMQFVEHNLQNSRYNLVEGDVLDDDYLSNAMRDCDFVFHFQANADVKGGMNNTRIDVEQNIMGTHNVLESMKINGIRNIAFASSATVYGEPEQVPTPEKIVPVQTSLYGASKYSAEALIQAYSEYFDINCWIFRFVSFMGPRYSHGVIFDFLKKLKNDPSQLHILGDGSQRKSYLHVSDGIDAILLAIEKGKGKVQTYNLGNREWIKVTDLADIVCSAAGFNSVRYSFEGGIRGWKGDTPFVFLDISAISSLGWNPRYSVKDTITETVSYLMEHEDLLYVRK